MPAGMTSSVSNKAPTKNEYQRPRQQANTILSRYNQNILSTFEKLSYQIYWSEIYRFYGYV